MMTADRYLSTSQAARLLGLSAERVRALVRSGQLASVPTALGALVPQDAVQDELRRRSTQAAQRLATKTMEAH